MGFWASSQPFLASGPLWAFCRPFLGLGASSGPFLVFCGSFLSRGLFFLGSLLGLLWAWRPLLGFPRASSSGPLPTFSRPRTLLFLGVFWASEPFELFLGFWSSSQPFLAFSGLASSGLFAGFWTSSQPFLSLSGLQACSGLFSASGLLGPRAFSKPFLGFWALPNLFWAFSRLLCLFPTFSEPGASSGFVLSFSTSSGPRVFSGPFLGFWASCQLACLTNSFLRGF